MRRKTGKLGPGFVGPYNNPGPRELELAPTEAETFQRPTENMEN